jgi:hypothetical protein
MEAESGPARAAALLAGEFSIDLAKPIAKLLIQIRPWIQ